VLINAINELSFEVTALVYQFYLKGVTNVPGRYVDGLSSTLLLSDCIAAVTDTVYGHRFCGGCYHPITTLSTNGKVLPARKF